jgi:hypothetical protein
MSGNPTPPIRAGILPNGADDMTDLKIKKTEGAGIKGWHRLSLCDIRHPLARKLEKEIVAFSEDQERRIKATYALFLAASLRLNAGEVSSTIQEEKKRLRAILRAQKDEKHRFLAQLYENLRDLTLTFDTYVPNIIPTAGRAVIAQWITGDNTYDADDGANYGSLGTSSTSPANGDTQLTAESYRKATSSVAQASNVATLSNFYTATEVTGTFEEAGWHIAGTATANTGQLLSHFLTGTIVKSSTETLTVESELTIS